MAEAENRFAPFTRGLNKTMWNKNISCYFAFFFYLLIAIPAMLFDTSLKMKVVRKFCLH